MIRGPLLPSFLLLLVIACVVHPSGSFQIGRGKGTDEAVLRWVAVEDLPHEIALHESVFWEPQDTTSLRKLLRETPLAGGKSVLEIGTGSGLLALCCWRAGASHIVATDINPHAIACATKNATRLKAEIDFRLVSAAPGADTSAFSVIGADERFDLIISNPPWEDAAPRQWSDYALYDPNFALLESLLDGVRDHLAAGGKVLLAYGCVEAVEVTRRLAAERNLYFAILDKRNPADLPQLFLPGMLIGLIPEEWAPSRTD